MRRILIAVLVMLCTVLIILFIMAKIENRRLTEKLEGYADAWGELWYKSLPEE